jgi:hypothetical protein
MYFLNLMNHCGEAPWDTQHLELVQLTFCI